MAKPKKKTARKIRDLKPRKQVKGGRTPSPSGPVPIPYPNQTR